MQLLSVFKIISSTMEPKETYFITFDKYLQPKNLIKDKNVTNTKQRNIKLMHFSEPINKSIGIWKPTEGLIGRTSNKDVTKRCSHTGFEDYCKMSSIHGFLNLVNAKAWQRWLWWCLICAAGLVSAIFIRASPLFNDSATTIHYIESMDFPAWPTPFPAVTICNFNRISKRALNKLPSDFGINATMLKRLFGRQRLTAQLSYNLTDMLAPSCVEQFLLCKWKGHKRKCEELFQNIVTPSGICCAFNYHVNDDAPPLHTPNCGFVTGLTVVLDAKVDDYAGALFPTPGYEVIVHDTYDYPDAGLTRVFVQTRTEACINVKPYSVVAHEILHSHDLHSRRCYFPAERELKYFRNYTQNNCLVECRYERIFDRCGCLPPMSEELWPICNSTQTKCVASIKDMRTQILESNSPKKRNSERYICDCFPLCQFRHYEFVTDFSEISDNYLNVNPNDMTVIHVFYGELVLEQLILYPVSTWLEILGTFGGITGLFMGCSFVSIFEIVFFMFFRPAFHWLTKQQLSKCLKGHHNKLTRKNVTPIKY